MLFPQQIAVPLSRTAQVWRSPVESEIKPVPPVSTEVGEGWLTMVPSPNCPRSFQPQQEVVSSERSTQVWCLPALITTAVSSPKSTVVDVFEDVSVPSPSWPWLLNPQHLSVVSSRRAQVCDSPKEIATALRP